MVELHCIMDEKKGLIDKISSFSPRGIPEEHTIARILLVRQVKSGKRMGYTITVGEQDIPDEHPEYKVWIGSQFIKWQDGGWIGEPGNVYGVFGGILDKILETQLKEDNERNKIKGNELDKI